jgi:ABC-type transport system involved in cytochrome bd biosynthesis fused ATPase/permease subunit
VVAIFVPLAVFGIIVAVMLLVAWAFDIWLPMLIAIALLAVVAELVWRNSWGDRWLRERLADRRAKPS